MYDYLIVGTGLFGSVLARELTDVGKKVLVIDKRSHIGGNCYTKEEHGIHVHKYGGHVFHTNADYIWSYINRFGKFNDFRCKVKVNYNNKIYSFPINLFTLNQVYGVITPEEAVKKLKEVRVPIVQPSNLEEYCLSEIGPELYNIFIKGYTEKQWGRPATELPASIIKRLPVRMDMNDDYFINAKYQGIPIHGYTKIFENILEGIEVKLNVDFIDDRKSLQSIANRVIYSGPIDEYYDYCFGPLEYRSLRFEEETVDGSFQGNHTVNYTCRSIPFTRIHEHKYFDMNPSLPKSVISREYPDSWSVGKERYYPINDDLNHTLYNRYKNIDNSKVIFGGRLGRYIYWDMDQTIASALTTFKELK